MLNKFALPFLIVCAASVSTRAEDNPSNSYFHEGRFCSGSYWAHVNGRSEAVSRDNKAQSIDLYVPANCDNCYIAVYDNRGGSTDYDYAWIKIQNGWRRMCVTFMNEGDGTPRQSWIERTSHSIWFSSGRGLEGKVSYVQYFGWPNTTPGRPPSGVSMKAPPAVPSTFMATSKPAPTQ